MAFREAMRCSGDTKRSRVSAHVDEDDEGAVGTPTAKDRYGSGSALSCSGDEDDSRTNGLVEVGGVGGDVDDNEDGDVVVVLVEDCDVDADVEQAGSDLLEETLSHTAALDVSRRDPATSLHKEVPTTGRAAKANERSIL